MKEAPYIRIDANLEFYLVINFVIFSNLSNFGERFLVLGLFGRILYVQVVENLFPRLLVSGYFYFILFSTLV